MDFAWNPMNFPNLGPIFAQVQGLGFYLLFVSGSPGKLVFFGSPAIGHEGARAKLLARLSTQGVPPEKIRLAGPMGETLETNFQP